MIRRMFRRGVRLGALAGIAYGVSKVLQSRRSQPQGATPAPWRPADLPPPPPRPAPVTRPPADPEPKPEPEPKPAAEPAADEVTVEVDDGVGPAASEPAGDAPPAPPAPPPPPAPAGEFDLPRVRPARPDASADTAKRAPTRAAKRPSKRASVAAKSWVEASGSVCPPSHPVKAKKTSFLYHLPGMSAYERTKPDRCYRDEKSAKADGFLPAKR